MFQRNYGEGAGVHDHDMQQGSSRFSKCLQWRVDCSSISAGCRGADDETLHYTSLMAWPCTFTAVAIRSTAFTSASRPSMPWVPMVVVTVSSSKAPVSAWVPTRHRGRRFPKLSGGRCQAAGQQKRRVWSVDQALPVLYAGEPGVDRDWAAVSPETSEVEEERALQEAQVSCSSVAFSRERLSEGFKKKELS